MLTVKIKNLTNGALAVGNLITAVSKINGIIVKNINFDQSNRALGAQQARRSAFNVAKSKADQYAQLSGKKIKKLSKISALDDGSFTPFYVTSDSFASNFNLLVPSRNVTITANV